MTAIEALKAAQKCVNPVDIDYCVSVGNGWVILGKPIPQALYVTEDRIRGLSPSIRDDEKIVAEAMRKIERGDFY